MGLLDKLFKRKKEEEQTQPIPIPQAIEEPQKPKAIVKTQLFKLEHLEEHMEDIMNLVCKNDDYKRPEKEILEYGVENEKIYEYELDEAATLDFLGGGTIAAYVDNIHIGDIKPNSTERAKRLLKKHQGNIKSIIAKVSGGNYKMLKWSSYDGDYVVENLSNIFGITIEITYREEIKEKAE